MKNLFTGLLLGLLICITGCVEKQNTGLDKVKVGLLIKSELESLPEGEDDSNYMSNRKQWNYKFFETSVYPDELTLKEKACIKKGMVPLRLFGFSRESICDKNKLVALSIFRDVKFSEELSYETVTDDEVLVENIYIQKSNEGISFFTYRLSNKLITERRASEDCRTENSQKNLSIQCHLKKGDSFTQKVISSNVLRELNSKLGNKENSIFDPSLL